MPFKQYLIALARRLIRRAVPEILALDGVSKDPFTWDVAALQLNQLSDPAHRRYDPYLYGLLCAARTARAAAVRKFTAIEFGVAGGNGLIALERYAGVVEEACGVAVDVVGFDMSTGLPLRTDPLDCPYAFQGGEAP
jgi:hypothetical protein